METINEISAVTVQTGPWNKGKLIGPKPPLQPKHVWATRVRYLGIEVDDALAIAEQVDV